MALKLRRGTDLERQSVIFEEGELVYTTDTKELWIGDGQTLGGIRVTGEVSESPISLTRNLDLNGFDIVGAGDVDIVGAVSASSFFGDGSGLINVPLFTEDGQYKINILSSDGSSLLLDSDANILYGNVEGDVVGNLTGDVLGTHFGSVFSENGDLIVDSVNNTLIGDLTTNKIACASGSRITVSGPPNISTEPFEVFVIGGDNTSFKIVTQSDGELSGTSYSGKLWFGYEDSTGSNVTSGILGAEDALYFVSNSSSVFSIETNYLSWQEPGKLGIGTYTPVQELDVRGNAIVTGFVQFGSLTTTERNALTPAAGMVIWNQTTTQFEGFDGTNWINLVNGVISA
jgi:hypothetical protein